MNSTITNIDAATTEWANRLAEGAPLKVETCRPGQEVSVSHQWDGGLWGRGSVGIAAVATLNGNWTAPVSGCYESRGSEECVWFQPPVNEPTLFKLVHAGRAAEGESRRHRDYMYHTFVLYIPQGESQEEFDRRQRREFASRQRDQLIKLGLMAQEIKAVFNAAGVGMAVEAVRLARATQAAVGERAYALLSEVANAPYGRERRLRRLAQSGIAAEFRSAGTLNRALDGAVAYLKPTVRLATLADLANKYRPGQV
jgi:hypothetical protein